MKMIYRGISYEYIPQTIKTFETTIVARYRGLTYNIKHPVNSANPLQLNLKYRDISYTRGQANKIPQSVKEKGAVVGA